MPKPLYWKVADEDRKKNVESMWWARPIKQGLLSATSDREREAMQKGYTLREKVLGFGGNAVCLDLYDEDYENIMQRGQFFYGSSYKRSGKVGRCHQNSCYLFCANPDRCTIATGYALSEDGIWRQHSWVVQPLATKLRVWETTPIKRVAYFGFVMTKKESEEFCKKVLMY